MNLVIDVGNSLVKLAVFKGSRLLELRKKPLEDFIDAVENFFSEYPDIRRSIVSSVGALGEKEIAALRIFAPVHELSHESVLPFTNRYATPNTLGVDRIALVTAAFSKYPRENCLVIDAGSCITYDLITREGAYLGGAISPGIDMRFKAMHHFTQKLPLIEDRDCDALIGDSTRNSMISGVVHGTVNEIDGIIKEYLKEFKVLTVILTGGDGLFLSKRLKSTIFAHSNFLLEGLNYILELNKRND
ncbi:type III pantothenate kinase [Robertkochia sediminum]|uniref:type III pantothenate kinase n=1 Tax=Robertkochia sediminum TaxID=2785326 RepID=UPI0019348ED8|nr:type III pantothenate kinase [Robertkochia sediminum]MBL7473005.1 type III pantothenate kinase [Robertkochia sediminum]